MVVVLMAGLLVLGGCHGTLMRQADRDVAAIVKARQRAALGHAY